MYGLISLLCVLGSIIFVSIFRNFGLLNWATAIFFSLFPLAFIAAAALLKRNALNTGVTSENKNFLKLGGLLLVILAIGWGCASPFMERWNMAAEPWVRPVLIWYAILAVANVITLAIEFSEEKKNIKVKDLQTGDIG